MRLRPVLPQESFYQTDTPNIKLYTGALPAAIKEALDRDTMKEVKLTQISQEKTPLKTFHLFRHFESNYNIYKKSLEENATYKEFLASNDPAAQHEMAKILLADFMSEVKIDYHTPLSNDGKAQSDRYGKLYGELFSSSPELIPDKIMVSPYTRTKHTAHALLKNLKGLDMDIDFLLNDDDLTDMRIGQMQGKEVVLSLTDEIRERDFGNIYGPRFIRDLAKSNTRDTPLDKIAQEKSYYYTSTNGGESQSSLNQRAKQFLNEITSNDRYKSRLIFTHHLFVLGALKNIFSGSFNTFHNLDNNRKPKNGSMTTLVELPSEEGLYPSARLRVAAYNMLPEEN